LGFACYTPSFTALQGDLTNKKNRAGLLSLITIIGAGGTLVGLLVSGFSADVIPNETIQYTLILEISAGIFIIAAIISLFLVDPPTERIRDKQPFTLEPLRRNKNFRRFVFINSLMSFSMSLGWPLFPYVREGYATALQNTLLWSIFSFLQIIVLLLTRKIINHIGRKKLLFFGRLFMFTVPLNLALTILVVPEWWFMAISSAISGASNAFYFIGLQSYPLDSANLKEKGTYTGVSNFFIGIATFIGSLIMGIIYDVLVVRYPAWLVLTILLFVVVGMRFLCSLTYLFIEEPSITKIATETEAQLPIKK
jgi:MFS family permease